MRWWLAVLLVGSITAGADSRHRHGAWLPGGTDTLRYYAHAVDWP